jgi:hypothetical protein
MARSIRRKSGKLRVGERRRRIRNAKPGEVVLLEVANRRTGKFGRGRAAQNSIEINLGVEQQWAADTDVRKLLHVLRIALGEHYRDSLLAGQKADGFGPLPPLKRDKGRTRGVLTGELAKRWGIGAITGGPFQARVKLRPYAAGERNVVITRELQRGNDYQSIEGAAAEVIQQVVAAWLEAAVPTGGDGVATPASVPTSKRGELPTFTR